MPTRLVFRCQMCDEEPDGATYGSLSAQLQELRFGEYVDAAPGGWLVWHGRGPYGPTRYACREHRVELRTSSASTTAPSAGIPTRACSGTWLPK